MVVIPGCDPEAPVPSVDVVSMVSVGRCRRLALAGCATDDADDTGAWGDPGAPGPTTTWSNKAGAVAADAD